ncbi:MAG: hypothetical protein ACK5H1_07895 [Tenacibaculum sp.]
MKNQANYYLAILLISLFFSCVTDTKETTEKLQQTISYKSYKIENNLTNNVFPKYHKSISLKGSFKLVKPNKKQVVIYTENQNFKHIFLVDKINKSDISKIKNITSLVYLKNALILNNDLLIKVERNFNEVLKKDSEYLSKKTNLIELKTKNLIYFWLPKNSSETLTIEELINKLNRELSVHNGDCEQGGEGSTSCSITSNTGAGCSVSCGSGYYACCNETLLGANDCHCHKSG